MKRFLFFVALNFFKTSCPHAQLAAFLKPPISQTVAPQYSGTAFGQHSDTSIIPKKRIYLIAGIHAASYAGTLAVLSTTWYNEYPKAPFHLFNDSREWLQIDKAGHAWTAYSIAKYSTALWRWAGVAHTKAVWLGGLSSLGYQTILESLDAHSSQWGWSWADMGANVLGATLYPAQELAWHQQRITLKFSSFPQRHDAGLQQRANALFGNQFQERLLKDYNSQTYWASVNLKPFFGQAPAWLNLAFGYGATGMYGGFENRAFDKSGALIFDRRDVPRARQWYLSPDVDWTKIQTTKKGIRTLFSLMNMIKMPAPALELSRGKLKAHWISF